MNEPPVHTDRWRPTEAEVQLPAEIGRYRVEKLLGEGDFGRVDLAHDDDLKRPVGSKVPRKERIWRPEDVEASLAEARTLASLGHPHIVPVYDLGHTEEAFCFVVSKFIESHDLAAIIKQTRLYWSEAAELVARLCCGREE
jgi:serine/threonine protein kinase